LEKTAIKNNFSKMKNKIAKVGALGTAFLASAMSAFAQVTYSAQSATTTNLFGSIVADLTTVLLTVVGSVIGLAVVLVGIGYGWRKLKGKVFGKAF